MSVADIYRIRFRTLGEAAAAVRGWEDASRGWGRIEDSYAYRKGYFDRCDYDDMREEARREPDEPLAI